MKLQFITMCLAILLMFPLLALSTTGNTETKMTIYIRSDGTVEPSDAPIGHEKSKYWFTADINGCIIVEKDDIILDGNNYTLYGAGDIKGIDLSNRKNVTITRLTIRNFSFALWLYYSSNNTIINNSIINNECGIRISHSNYNNITRNLFINNSQYGMYLVESKKNSIIANKITNNQYGIFLLGAIESFLRNNIFENNAFNFGVHGLSEPHFVHDVDFSNIINGKPICYWVDHHNETVPLNVSCVYIVKSSNITIENLTLSNSVSAILLAYTTDSTIRNVTTTKCLYGIWLHSSANNNLICNSNSSYNEHCGIHLSYCFGNEIINNTLIGNQGTASPVGTSGGLFLEDTTCITIEGNIFVNNSMGIGFDDSFHINVSRNYVINSLFYGFSFANLAYSELINNTLIDNQNGIYLLYSNPVASNIIYHNNFINNDEHVHVHMMPGGHFEWNGNYWDDYEGLDINRDGIGDSSYIIVADYNYEDKSPLTIPSAPIPLIFDDKIYLIELKSSSTISQFRFNATEKKISFNVTGSTGTIGFCNLSIPNALIQEIWQNNYTILLDGEKWPFSNWTDGKYTYIYLNYTHSEHKITIIPELKTFQIISFLIIFTTTLAITKKKQQRVQQRSNKSEIH